MIGRGAEPDRIHVCYTGVDSDMWRPDDSAIDGAAQLGVDGQVPLILYAGRICAQKQPQVFGATMLRLNTSGSLSRRSWPATAPFSWLRQFVEQHDLRSVRLLGAVSNQRVNELLKSADLFFLPSEWEGIALSIYEAMASGVAWWVQTSAANASW